MIRVPHVTRVPVIDRTRGFAALMASAIVALALLSVAGCKTYERETAAIAPQARYFPTPKSPAEIPTTLVDAIGDSDILLLGESHYVAEHHDFLALLLPRLHERGFRLFLTESNHAYGYIFDEYVTGRRDSLTPAQSSLDSSWLEAMRALNAELRASGRERDQMRVRAIDVNHLNWRPDRATRSSSSGSRDCRRPTSADIARRSRASRLTLRRRTTAWGSRKPTSPR
jgi:hypothetical protein